MSPLPRLALDLLTQWLPPNSDPERPRIQLATVDGEGRPDVRTVLLSEWTADGFAFHTDAASRKVAQLAANPAAALDILWPGFARQLTVQGIAERTGADDDARAYSGRSAYLRQLAWQNTAEMATLAPLERERRWARFQAEHDLARIAPPDTWVGFLLRPTRLTFWQADPAAPSHRVEFQQAGDAWTRSDLPG